MSAAKQKLDEAIQHIASIHGIVVSKDDPVMILHTLNERLIQDSKAAQQDLLDNFKSEIDMCCQKWSPSV